MPWARSLQFRAQTLQAASVVYVAAGRTDAATHALRHTLDLYEAKGAVSLAARIQRELAALERTPNPPG